MIGFGEWVRSFDPDAPGRAEQAKHKGCSAPLEEAEHHGATAISATPSTVSNIALGVLGA